MTKEEFLQQVGKIQHRLDMMKLRCEEYDRLASSIPGPCLDKVGSSGTKNHEAPFVKWIYKKLDLEEEMKQVRKQLDEKRAEIITAIEALVDEKQKSVLMLRYISLLGFTDICKKMLYSLSTIKRWHREGIEKIKIPILKIEP